MTRQTLETVDIEAPHALRSAPGPAGLPGRIRHLRATVSPLFAAFRATPPDARYKPIAIGALAALMVGFVLDIGPVPTLAHKFFGVADAQETNGTGALPGFGSGEEPLEADKAALRYFAREGDVERLEAELRRLRALYPGWQPERNLLDPESEDIELQAMWDLFGEGDYDGALAAIRERQEEEPGWTPPADLERAIELATARIELVAASDARDFEGVLAIALQNEALLTCDNVDALWRVAEAFANTDRLDRAYDAYAYVLQNCPSINERIATLQKASQVLDPGELTRLFSFERTGNGVGEFEGAKLEIVRGAVARGGEDPNLTVPFEWLQIVSDSARNGNTGDAMLVGWYLLTHGNPGEAAGWFRFATAEGQSAEAAEGYIIALRETNDRANEALAREVAYQWRNQSPSLMEVYLQSVSTLLTSDFGFRDLPGREGAFSFDDVTEQTVDRFVPVVIEQQDANGAQALGWYSFNTCQFIIAEEWFITSANWEPTEAALFGLALSRLRLGDLVGFFEVVDEWGGVYEPLIQLANGLDTDPVDPATNELPVEIGLESVICDPEEIERLRERLRQRGDEVVFVEAGSTTAGTAVTEGGTTTRLTVRRQERPTIPRRSDLETRSFAQLDTPPAPEPVGPSVTTPPRSDTEALRATTPTVERRVRRGLPREIPGFFGGGGGGGGGGGTAAQRALSNRDFARCIAITDRSMRAGRLSSDDALARGFCLLELERPVEAGQAFQLAVLTTRYGSTRQQDAVFGETLAALASQQTDKAAHAATKTPLSRARRTQLGIDILTQRALAAYEDERFVEAIMYLDEREQIAPLQKDLMVLRGYAHLNLGEIRRAEQLFEAVNRAGQNGTSLGAINAVRQQIYRYDTGTVCENEPLGRCYYFTGTERD